MRAALVATVSLPLLVACQNNEQSMGLGGAALGSLACGVAGNSLFHSTAGTLISAAGCGAVGYLVGSAIGRQLDERDRERAAAATQQALAQPVSYPHRATTNVVRPRARPVSWKSDHGTGNAGSATVVALQPEPNGGECRTVREVAYIKGKETTQETKFCRSPNGSWAAA